MLSEQGLVEEMPLQLSNFELIPPRAGEIAVSVEFCGVCRTDLHIIEGDLETAKLPIVPGHQIVGTLAEIGDDVTGFRIGDRVGVPWMSSTCMSCKYCHSSRENLCHDARFTGLHVDGGYGERTVVPAQFVYPLPEEISPAATAPLLCAGVIGYRTLKLSGVSDGQRIGLYGFGASAHVTIQVARH